MAKDIRICEVERCCSCPNSYYDQLREANRCIPLDRYAASDGVLSDCPLPRKVFTTIPDLKIGMLPKEDEKKPGPGEVGPKQCPSFFPNDWCAWEHGKVCGSHSPCISHRHLPFGHIEGK